MADKRRCILHGHREISVIGSLDASSSRSSASEARSCFAACGFLRKRSHSGGQSGRADLAVSNKDPRVRASQALAAFCTGVNALGRTPAAVSVALLEKACLLCLTGNGKQRFPVAASALPIKDSLAASPGTSLLAFPTFLALVFPRVSATVRRKTCRFSRGIGVRLSIALALMRRLILLFTGLGVAAIAAGNVGCRWGAAQHKEGALETPPAHVEPGDKAASVTGCKKPAHTPAATAALSRGPANK